MNRYLSNNSQPYLDVGPEYERVQFCFQKMRELVSKRNNNVTASQVTVVTHSSPSQTDNYFDVPQQPNEVTSDGKNKSKACIVM